MWIAAALAQAAGSRIATPFSTRAPAAVPSISERANRAFEYAVDLCERRLSGDGNGSATLQHVPELLAQVFQADFDVSLAYCQRAATNVTCLCPKAGANGQGLLDKPLIEFQCEQTDEGRRQCADGGCSAACSRVLLGNFASPEECEALVRGVDSLTAPASQREECTLDLSELCATGDVRTTLLFLRLLERLRRMVAHEYGLPIDGLITQSAFTSRIPHVAGRDNYGALHADESSSEHFHYSAVLHLHSRGDGFTGGDFVFSDAHRVTDGLAADGLSVEDDSDAQRTLTRVAPLQGRAVMFSSGWENVHYVDSVRSGVRFSLPVFFRARPMEAVDGGGEAVANDHTLEMCRWLSHTWDTPEAFAQLQQDVFGNHESVVMSS